MLNFSGHNATKNKATVVSLALSFNVTLGRNPPYKSSDAFGIYPFAGGRTSPILGMACHFFSRCPSAVLWVLWSAIALKKLVALGRVRNVKLRPSGNVRQYTKNGARATSIACSFLLKHGVTNC